jgi:hypothetical protein
MAFTACEWNEDLFKGAVAGTSLFVGYFNAVAEEVGGEKAAELLRKFGAAMGEHTGQMCKQQLGDQPLDVKKLAEFAIGVAGSFGEKLEVEYERNSFRLRIHNCPFVEAYKALGMDMESGKSVCLAIGESFSEDFLKVIAPDGHWDLARCRERFDDYCEECYSLGE